MAQQRLGDKWFRRFRRRYDSKRFLRARRKLGSGWAWGRAEAVGRRKSFRQGNDKIVAR